MPQQAKRTTARPTWATPSVVVAVLGVVLLLLAFTVLRWFRQGGTEFHGFFRNPEFGSATTFGQVHEKLDALQSQVNAAGIQRSVSFDSSAPYFSWLGWLLLVLATVFTVLRLSPFGADRFYVTWLATVTAVAGLAMTWLALNLIVFANNSAKNADAPAAYTDFVRHSGPGAWAAMAGFALLAIDAWLPRPRPATAPAIES